MGCASIANRMVIPAILESADFELALVSSRNADKAKEYADKFSCNYVVGYDQLIENKEIDVIYMPLPTGLHLEWALKALDAGKHILFEKSLAVNFLEAKQIVEKARFRNLLIQENFMFAFHRQMGVIKDLISSNRAGDIRCIRSSFGFPPFPDGENIRYSKELGGGALLDAGAYTLKISQLLLGNDIKVIGSTLNFDDQKGVDIYGSIHLHNPMGIAVETAFGFDHFYQCNLEIWGNKAKITADRIFTAGPGVSPKIKIEENGNTEVIDIEPDNHFLNLLNDFASTIRSGDYQSNYNEIETQAFLVQSTCDKAIKFLNR